MYEAVDIKPNHEKIKKIISVLNLKISPRDLKSKSKKDLLHLILSQWLSLSTCVAQTIIDVVPAPSIAQAIRLPRILNPNTCDACTRPKNKVEMDLFSSNCSPDANVVAYVSKMFAFPREELPNSKRKSFLDQKTLPTRLAREPASASSLADFPRLYEETASLSPEEVVADDDTEVLLGFARLFSGILRKGTSTYAILPKYRCDLDPSCSENADHLVVTKIEGLYAMMGRELVAVDVVRAGNIFAVEGLQGKVWRNATLCAPGEAGIDPTGIEVREFLVNLGAINRPAPPIVRIALEPVRPADMPKLLRGLKLLTQSDSCIETFQQQTGEHVVLTAGELHLERCLKDLRERFARVEIQSSKPIVPFRETAVKIPGEFLFDL